jgi:hypothetical protein
VRVAFVLGVTAAPVAVLLVRWCLRGAGMRGIERRLEHLCTQVMGWQAAHDHQVETIDRRLRDVEASAARAENEARIVSVQLADMSRSLVGRLDQVEHRIGRSPSGRGGSCSVMAAAGSPPAPRADLGVALGVGA